MRFLDRLGSAWRINRSTLCVGLDPDLRRLPPAVLRDPDPITCFLREIVDATAPHCAAFKPQIAYFAAVGAERSLERILEYIEERYPSHLRLLDAKRGDIGDTATMYAREAFERYRADAVTVNPYLGTESIAPFVADPARGCFLLCRTSNTDSDALQGYGTPHQPPLYQRVAALAAGDWNRHRNLGLVVGATQPDAMQAVRAIAADLPLLVPGIGAQGGDPHAVVRAGRTADGYGLLVSSSRAILYASDGPDFARAAAEVAAATSAELRGVNEFSAGNSA